MEATIFFNSVVAMLMTAFLYFGMDVRRTTDAQRFVAPVWQTLMKFCSFSLIVAFAAVVIHVTEPETIDWVSLSLLAVGTAFVVAAKYALGVAHTFTGQFLELYFDMFVDGVDLLSPAGADFPA